MTNAEAAAHFASLPAHESAEILLIDGGSSGAETLMIDPPGTNLDEVEEGFLNDGDEKLVTTYVRY